MRQSNKQTFEWAEYPDVPFSGGPPMPALAPPPRRPGRAPDPPHPLDAAGRDLWRALVGDAWDEADRRRLLRLCELEDRRAALLVDDPDDRFRTVDEMLATGLDGWCARHSRPRLTTWPRETRDWWAAVSALPHAVSWQAADWRHVADTAHVHAAVMNGDAKLWPELRTRERVIGTTADARRDLRIRYVKPQPAAPETPASVTTMDAYRQVLGE